MKATDYSKCTFEELIKHEKTTKTATGALLGIIIIQVIVGVYLTIKQGFSVFTILPICFIPILVINYANIKKLRSEIDSRKK